MGEATLIYLIAGEVFLIVGIDRGDVRAAIGRVSSTAAAISLPLVVLLWFPLLCAAFCRGFRRG